MATVSTERDTFSLSFDPIEPREGLEVGFVFDGVVAYRHRAESHCTVWHIGAYDTLVRIPDSAWARELSGAGADPGRSLAHYMIYLDSDGSFEVVAESWAVRRSSGAENPRWSSSDYDQIPERTGPPRDQVSEQGSGPAPTRVQSLSSGQIEAVAFGDDVPGVMRLRVRRRSEAGAVLEEDVDLLWVRAFQYRAARDCPPDVRCAADALVEVRDSEWVAELRAAMAEDLRNNFTMRHFMIYLDGYGCYEFVAESWAYQRAGTGEPA